MLLIRRGESWSDGDVGLSGGHSLPGSHHEPQRRCHRRA